MGSSHDFRVLTYVEESDWTTVYRTRCCDWTKDVRGAQPLVGCHGFNRVGSLVGAVACQSHVKAVLHAPISRLLFQELKTHIVVQAVSQNETSLGYRSSFRTFSLW